MSRKVPSSNRAQKIINYTIGDNAGIHLTGGGYINDDPANTGGQYTSGVSNSANLSHMTMSNMSNMNFIQGSSIQLGGGGGRSGSGSGGGGTGGVTGNGGGSRGARQQMAMLSTPVNIQGPTDINYQANINKPSTSVINDQRNTLARDVAPKINVPVISCSIFDYLSTIGHGAFSKVFKVRIKENGTIRAAKRIEIHGTSDRNNALDEFTKLTQLDPDYVVKCHDWWIENDHFYIFMDYHRDTLRDIIELKPGVYDRDQGQPMDVTEFYMSCQIFRQLLDGVNYLHGLRPKMIHRDLKPDNILVSYANDPARFVRLCDFGLAVNHDKTCNNQGSNFHTHDVGTVRYQAPEIARGKGGNVKYNHKVDVYSVGLIGFDLFELDQYESSKNGETDQDDDENVNFLKSKLKVMVKDDPDERPECYEMLANFENNRCLAINTNVIKDGTLASLISKLKDDEKLKFFYEFFEKCQLATHK